MGIILILLIAAAVFLFILSCPRGRRNAPGLHEFDGWYFAHRGYHQGKDAPENSLAAFRLAVQNGFGAELDVHLLADGGLAVLHDSGLKHMTGEKGTVEKLRTQDLKEFHLCGSEQTIPTLREVLDVFEGKTPLIIELKPTGTNVGQLCEAVCRELEDYRGLYCIESFDPRVVRWLRRNRPRIIRGQLAMNYRRSGKKKKRFTETVIGTHMLQNFLTRPDFAAYRFQERETWGNRIALKLWHLQGASWTLRTREECEQALAEGLWPIFENFDPRV